MTIKLFFQALIKFLLGVLLVGLLIFIPAGTVYFARGWLFMGILFIPIFAVGIILMIKDPSLLKKRLSAKEKQLMRSVKPDRVAYTIQSGSQAPGE